jgi:hypothetical protein
MAKNTIKIKKYSDVIEEIDAAGTITPGMLIELDSNGDVQAHSTEGGVALPMFALEDELQGNEIDDDYSAGDKVQVWIPYRGDQVYALLAQGEDVAIGAFLDSNGDGTLKEYTGTTASDVEFPQSVVAQALEDVDASDADTRIEIRVI